jgi:hypothetical protein
MRAVVLTSHGGPEVLTIAEVPTPVPGPDEVLVQVAATALNRADLLQRMGLYPDPRGAQPEIPGLEFAGTVAAVGQRVRMWAVGDRVMGIEAGGGYAEYLATHERQLMAVPEGWRSPMPPPSRRCSSPRGTRWCCRAGSPAAGGRSSTPAPPAWAPPPFRSRRRSARALQSPARPARRRCAPRSVPTSCWSGRPTTGSPRRRLPCRTGSTPCSTSLVARRSTATCARWRHAAPSCRWA